MSQKKELLFRSYEPSYCPECGNKTLFSADKVDWCTICGYEEYYP